MSLIFCDHFPYSTPASMVLSSSNNPFAWSLNLTTSMEMTAGTLSHQYLRATSTSVHRNVRLIDQQNNYPEGAWGMHCYLGDLPSGELPLLAFSDGDNSGADQVYLYVSEDGEVSARRGVGGDVIGTSSTGVVAADIFFYIEAFVKVHPTDGIVRVWIDDVLVMNITEANTRLTGNNQFDRVRVNFNSGFSVTGKFMTFGAPYLAQERLGVSRITVLRPISDHAVQWAPSEGTDNFDMVNDAPTHDGDSTKVTVSGGAQQGFTDLYGTEVDDVEFNPQTIYGINVAAYGLRTNINNRVRMMIEHDTVQAEGATVNFGSVGFRKVSNAFSLNPSTGSRFTVAELDDLKFGFKAQVMDTLLLEVTQCYCEVLSSVGELQIDGLTVPAGEGASVISDGLTWLRLGALPA